jgi:hypothetical protein
MLGEKKKKTQQWWLIIALNLQEMYDLFVIASNQVC